MRTCSLTNFITGVLFGYPFTPSSYPVPSSVPFYTEVDLRSVPGLGLIPVLIPHTCRGVSIRGTVEDNQEPTPDGNWSVSPRRFHKDPFK